MFASLVSARRALDAIALSFDASALAPQAALSVVDELGSIRRLVDGMIAQAAKRVSDTRAGDAVPLVARTLGVGTGEVRAALETASRLANLPLTDVAVREGRLSAGATQLIAAAATANPAAEEQLLKVAAAGLAPLRDACVAARAAVEHPDVRAKRQRAQRRFGMWTDADGMIAGNYRLAPEIGGPVKAVFDAAVQRIFRDRKAGADHESLEAYAATPSPASCSATTLKYQPRASARPCTSSSITAHSCAAARSTAKYVRSPASGPSTSPGHASCSVPRSSPR
jgi:hypothetical protein